MKEAIRKGCWGLLILAGLHLAGVGLVVLQTYAFLQYLDGVVIQQGGNQ